MKSSVVGSVGATVAALCCAGVPAVLVLGWIGAALLVVGIFLYPLVYAGIAAMLGAAAWNTVALRSAAAS